jgi:hypothetical protein
MKPPEYPIAPARFITAAELPPSLQARTLAHTILGNNYIEKSGDRNPSPKEEKKKTGQWDELFREDRGALAR